MDPGIKTDPGITTDPGIKTDPGITTGPGITTDRGTTVVLGNDMDDSVRTDREGEVDGGGIPSPARPATCLLATHDSSRLV